MSAQNELPMIVTGSLFGAKIVTVGDTHACAVRSNGDLWCWGTGGLVGDGTATSHPSPVPVGELGGVVAIGAGEAHTCAVQTTGDVFCWGVGTQGQTTERYGLQWVSPIQVYGLPHPAVGIAAHEGNHSCALLNDGTAWCWGANDTGQLGDGTITARFLPTPMKMN